MSIDAGSERFYEFDVATQVQQVAAADIDGSVSYLTRVHPGWDIMGNANGGYLLALVGHALTQATQRNHCITVTAHYLAPCPAGEMWDVNGVLVAQSRQLALAPRQK